MTHKLLLALLTAGALDSVQAAGTFSIPVIRKTGSELGTHSFAANARFATQSKVTTVDDQGFWFSNFTIGAGKSLEILLDSGSSDAILNPNTYKPGSNSKKTGRSFTVSYATTNPDGSGSETARGPIYQDSIGLDGTNLTVKNQYLGSITSPASPPTFPHQGLIGFAGQDSSFLNASPWFHSLCTQKSLAQCRFGMAFGTDGTGQMYYGSINKDSFNGDLSRAATNGEWVVRGDIVVNGKIVTSNARIITDSGTTVIFGPTADVIKMFKAAGMQYTQNGNTVDGTYDCSNPPKLGFGFPSASQAAVSTHPLVSANSTVFNVVPKALAQKTSNGKCTASIHGSDQFGGEWLVGQAFFQGHYIDHDVDGGTMGFANLK